MKNIIAARTPVNLSVLPSALVSLQLCKEGGKGEKDRKKKVGSPIIYWYGEGNSLPALQQKP